MHGHGSVKDSYGLNKLSRVHNIYYLQYIYKFKNEVGIQVIKVVKQEMNNGSYYSIAQWEIPTLALNTK